MALWYLYLLDVQGAFLLGQFTNGEELHMEVPEGMKQFYPSDVVLWLLKTIYGLWQASYEFWKLLLRTMRKLKYEKSKDDPCLYFKWKSGRLSLWLSWVDDLINLGSKEDVKQAVKNMKQ